MGWIDRMKDLFNTKDMHLLTWKEKLSLVIRLPLLVLGDTVLYVLEQYDPEWVDPLNITMDGDY